MGNIIEATGLLKSFGDFQAVKSINLKVAEGSMFAFLGPNGAGKSTVISMLTTGLAPDGGHATINGHRLGIDNERIRSSIGIVFQDSLLDSLLTVRENLQIRGRFYGFKRDKLEQAVREAAAVANADEFLDRPYGILSGGQRRRADIARALIHTPTILFLDEPTTGLDPQTRVQVWKTIRQLQNERGMTIFLTTHYMEEAAEADYITVIDHGSIMAAGTPVQLKQQYASDLLRLWPIDHSVLENSLTEQKLTFEMNNGCFVIPVETTLTALSIIDRMRDNISNLELVNGTMNDVFLNLTGSEIRNG